MSQLWHPNGISPPSAGSFYPASRLADMLESRGFEEFEQLKSAARIIEGDFHTGRETYLEHFRGMGILDPPKGQVEKTALPVMTTEMLTEAAEVLLAENNQSVAETAERANSIVLKFPGLLFAGPSEWHEQPNLLEQVAFFTSESKPGQREEWIRTMLVGGACLSAAQVAVCDIDKFPAEMQQSLQAELVD